MGFIYTKRSVKLNINYIPNEGNEASMGTVLLEKDRIFNADVAEVISGLSNVTIKSEHGKYTINVPFQYMVVTDEKKYNSVKPDLRYHNLEELLESSRGVFVDLPKNLPTDLPKPESESE